MDRLDPKEPDRGLGCGQRPPVSDAPLRKVFLDQRHWSHVAPRLEIITEFHHRALHIPVRKAECQPKFSVSTGSGVSGEKVGK